MEELFKKIKEALGLGEKEIDETIYEENQENKVKKGKAIVAGVLVAVIGSFWAYQEYFIEDGVKYVDDVNPQEVLDSKDGNTLFVPSLSKPNWQEITNSNISQLKESITQIESGNEESVQEIKDSFQEQIQMLLDEIKTLKERPPVVQNNPKEPNSPVKTSNHNNPQTKIPPPPKLYYDVEEKNKEDKTQPVTLTKPSGIKYAEQAVGRTIKVIHRVGEIPATPAIEYPEHYGVIPAGSFAKITLISGIDAGTGEIAREHPQPILLRLSDNFAMPALIGRAKYKLKGCLILGSATGDLSASRVYIQLTKISCLIPNTRYWVTGEMSGSVLDIDNKLGLMGTVELRQGAILQKALAASMVGGVSKALGTISATQLSNALSDNNNIDGELFTQSVLGGAFSEAGESLAEIYKKQLEEIHHIISIPPFVNGKPRTGSVLIQQNISLSWEKY